MPTAKVRSITHRPSRRGENQPHRAGAEQLQTQLAGCLVAAEGGATGNNDAHQGDYGWSPAFEAVKRIRRERDDAREAAQKEREEGNYLLRAAETDAHYRSERAALLTATLEAVHEVLSSSTVTSGAILAARSMIEKRLVIKPSTHEADWIRMACKVDWAEGRLGCWVWKPASPRSRKGTRGKAKR